MTMTLSFQEIEKIFQANFGHGPGISARAPGRVNLIGEHTDYNEGFVFPAALECEVKILASRRNDEEVHLSSVNFNQKDKFDINRFNKSSLAWSNYIRGVISELQKRGHKPRGFNAVISGDVPLGSGLSSSAALEVAAAVMLRELFKLDISKPELAVLCQRAENSFVGVNCGIMDQFISLLGEINHALLIDCRNLTYHAVPLSLEKFSIVICDSLAPRELAGSAYNQRRAECQEGVRLLSVYYPGINSLRDVSMKQFKSVEYKLPGTLRKRCRHVISENNRTLEAAKVLEKGKLEDFGRLMFESHYSLRDDYEVSSEYLDILVESAAEGAECLGSRLTGAGFGGCTVSLVRSDEITTFINRVSSNYEKRTGKTPAIYTSKACQGAEAKKLKN
ncbi:MAG: galactokinase [Firmicutes bacterium]|nr:galactokinase [Bacillota bacterium]